MALVRIVGHKESGRYIAHEVPSQKTAEVIKKLKEQLGVIRIESRLILPPVPKFTNNTKI